MTTFFISYLTSSVVMVLLDAMWLLLMVQRFYRPLIGHLMANTISIVPALLFYALYPATLTLLIVLPALKDAYTLPKAFLYGALLGVTAYATYNLTNQAILISWPIKITIVDTIWGGMVTGITTIISLIAIQFFAKL